PTGHGYWLVTADGKIGAFGDAHNYGDLRAHALAAPIVGMAATTTGHGYWMLGGDGGVFSFGGAPFPGSPRGRHPPPPLLPRLLRRSPARRARARHGPGIEWQGLLVRRGRRGSVLLRRRAFPRLDGWDASLAAGAVDDGGPERLRVLARRARRRPVFVRRAVP